MKINNWKIIEDQLDQKTYLENNTIFSLANGYFGTRGAIEESISLSNNDGTFINGFYDKENFVYPNSSIKQAKERQKMLFAPNSKPMDIKVDGVTLDPQKSKGYKRELNLENAILTKEYSQTIKGANVKLVSERLVSIDYENIMSVKSTIVSDKKIKLEIDSQSEFFKIFLAEKHLSRKTRLAKPNPLILKKEVIKKNDEQLVLFNTDASNLELYFGVKFIFNKKVKANKFGNFVIELKPNEKLEITKNTYYNWINHDSKKYSKLISMDFETLKKAQEKTYKEFWEVNDIKIEGDSELQASMRFNVFSLFQNTGKNGLTNVCAKGLTGEGYDGHYFWDTEIFVLPFFTFTNPEIAKALLDYRYKILPIAKERAKEMSFDGALFPWRTINGLEASPFFPAGTAQIHINADIAYALIQYVEATDDIAYLEKKGYEMLYQICKFYISYADNIKGKGWGFNLVTGPDEYTALVNNNAYTNYMVKNIFARVLEFSKKTNKFKDIISKVKQIHDGMYIPKLKSGLIEQNEGFFEKSPWPFGDKLRPLLSHYHPMVIYKYQITKQADLILAMNLIPQYFTDKELKLNYDYYKKITTHDSSLSKCSFAQLGSHLGYKKEAFEYFDENVKTDLYNTHKNTADGVHIASQAGSWQTIVYGFAGLQVLKNKLSLKNNLPKEIKSIEFKVWFKKRLIQVNVDQKKITAKVIKGSSLEILINKKGTKI